MATISMTKAADRFTDRALKCWDAFSAWDQTAKIGLSETDRDELQRLCNASGEEYDRAESEVLTFVRAHRDRLDQE